MRLTPHEKELLKHLIDKEIKEFDKDASIVRHDIVLLKGEEEYDTFLKALKTKLK